MAQTTNALDILIGALPTEVASSIAQQFSISIPQSTTLITSASTTSQSSSTTTTSQSSTTASSSSTITSSFQSTSTTSTQTSASVTSTTSTQTSGSSTSSASIASQPTSAPVATIQNQLSGGAIAGIVVGCVIGSALLVLLLLLCLRRRNTRNSGRDSGRSSLLSSLGRRKEQVYPEVAWLYDPVRPMSRDGRTSQDPLRSAGMMRPSQDDAPRLGANAPWSSRPSTSTDQPHLSSPGMLPMPTQMSPLGPSMFQPPRDRSVSNPNRYYSPPMPQEEIHEDVVSPLLPPPVQPSGRFGRRAANFEQSPYNQRSNDPSPAADNRTPMMSSVGFSPYNGGRAF